MDRNTALVIIATIVAIVVMVYFLIKFGIIHRKTTTAPPTTTTSPITITIPTTTCNISCPPGYSVDPLLCICSPLVPYNIVVQPSPTFNIRLWLALGLVPTIPTEYISYEIGIAPCVSQGKYISPGKACMGVLSNTTSCCPSSSPTCGCELCDPTYGCNPQTAQTSGYVSFYATVISSNGTPIPNTQVNVQSPLPMTIDIPLTGLLGQWGTIQLTLQPPPQSVQTDENGNAIITVPFTAKLTYYNYALADSLLGNLLFQTLCNYSKTFALQFNLSIPDTAIVVPAFVQTNVSVCVHVN